MIELVFVIVVLGILAGIAIPKFAATRDDAKIAKARTTVASVRSGIVTERQQRLFRGENNFTATLDSGSPYFTNVMQYGVSSGKWSKPAANQYKFTLNAGRTATFDYNASTGTFGCSSGNLCSTLTE